MTMVPSVAQASTNMLPSAWPVARYRFTFVLEQTLHTSFYMGSAFRGVFGRALRRVCCITRTPTCDNCLLTNTCPFTTLFATENINEPGRPSRVPPYVVEPQFDLGRHTLEAGEQVVFNMILLGPAIEQLALLIHAWTIAWKHGVGRERAKGRLLKVECINGSSTQTIYTPGARIGNHEATLQMPKPPQADTLEVRFTTPARLLVERKLIRPEQFASGALLHGLMRRYASIARNGWLPPVDWREISRHWPNPELLECQLRWTHWARYSSRQKQKMDFPGLMGRVVLDANWRHWWPLLVLGERLHVGKNTSFGLGRIELRNASTCM
jgi:hypothetical protein